MDPRREEDENRDMGEERPEEHRLEDNDDPPRENPPRDDARPQAGARTLPIPF